MKYSEPNECLSSQRGRPHLHRDGTRMAGLWEAITRWSSDGGLPWWHECLFKKRKRNLSIAFLSFSATRGQGEKVALCNKFLRELSAELHLPTPWTSQPLELWYIYFCCSGHPVYGILLQQQEQTKVRTEMFIKHHLPYLKCWAVSHIHSQGPHLKSYRTDIQYITA